VAVASGDDAAPPIRRCLELDPVRFACRMLAFRRRRRSRLRDGWSLTGRSRAHLGVALADVQLRLGHRADAVAAAATATALAPSFAAARARCSLAQQPEHADLKPAGGQPHQAVEISLVDAEVLLEPSARAVEELAAQPDDPPRRGGPVDAEHHRELIDAQVIDIVLGQDHPVLGVERVERLGERGAELGGEAQADEVELGIAGRRDAVEDLRLAIGAQLARADDVEGGARRRERTQPRSGAVVPSSRRACA
jgi:hypothetical protein